MRSWRGLPAMAGLLWMLGAPPAGAVTVDVALGPATTTTTLPAPACTRPRAVARARARVAELCDCAGAVTHRAYVRCAAHVLKAQIRAGRLPRSCRDAATSCTTRSTCGRPGAVSCCRTTVQGVQTCSIKPSAAACRRPKGGSACVSDQPSCCDACGGATCPAPPTTTSTTLPREACFLDSDCRGGNPCDGRPRCLAGFCAPEGPLHCPDGTPALWLGIATSFTRSFNIAITTCGDDGFFSGTLGCPSDLVPCAGGVVVFSGTIIISVDGITIAFNPSGLGDGSRCNFDGRIVGLTMGGGFRCFDPFGFTVSTGTWSTSRCP